MKLRTLSIVLAAALVAGYIIRNRWRQPTPETVPLPTNTLTTKPSTKSHLPASVPFPMPEVSGEDPEPTNLVGRLRQGLSLPPLTLAQVQPYLEANRRNAASLLAAFRTTGERALLQEAQEKYPEDPQVNLVSYYPVPYREGELANSECSRWLEALKQSDSENPLGNYLAARDHFKSGQTERAMEELSAASGKPQFQDYSADFIQSAEEAWRAAGYSEAEAKTVASASLIITPIVELKRMAEDLVASAEAYQQSGDATSAGVLLRAGVVLGQQLDQPSAEGPVRNLAGLRIEAQVLSAMEPTALYDSSGRSVADRLAEVAQRREALLALAEQAARARDTMTDSDIVSYYDREKTFGSESALRWLASRQTSDSISTGGEGVR